MAPLRWLAAARRGVAAGLVAPYTWMTTHWPGHNYEDDEAGDERPAPARAAVEGAAARVTSIATAHASTVADAATVDAGVGTAGTVGTAGAADGPDEGPDAGDGDEAGVGSGAVVGARSRPWRVPVLGLRQIRTVGVAVYGALADPLVGGDKEARARRAARARRVGLVTATTALAGVMVYSIFPIRAFLDQWEATNRAERRLDVLTEGVDEAEEQIERLQDEEEIERIAREDYGLILPGEESYPLLPAPEEPAGDPDRP